MYKETLNRLIARQDLSTDELSNLIALIEQDQLSDSRIAGFLVALLMKGPTVDEIAAIVRAMTSSCNRIYPRVKRRLIDTCGTGGGLSTINVSTCTAIVASAAGIPVAKHGSRSLSSFSGSADVLEKAGVNISLTPAQSQRLIEEIGIAFLYAPLYHPIMLRILPPEQELGIKTIFYTIIGPLINPAGARGHILGVYKPELVDQVATIIQQLDFDHAMVVHGMDGYDEISLAGPTMVAEVRNGEKETYEIRPEDFGLKRAPFDEVKGGTPEQNAAIMQNIIAGKETGPKRDLVLLNSAAAMLVAGKVNSMEDGLKLAESIIVSGKAAGKLQQLVEYSNALASAEPKEA